MLPKPALLLAASSLLLFACAAPIDEETAASGAELADEDGDVADANLALTQAAVDPPASSAAPLTLWVAPGGSDKADGTEDHPLASLSGVHDHLSALAKSLEHDVVVRIAPGTYRGEDVRWTLPSGGHSVSFMPAGFEVGMGIAKVKALGGRPIFDGTKACESKKAGATCKFFLVDQPRNSGPSRLRFYYLDVRDYATTGIGLHNDGEGRNIVFGCRFANIGTYPSAYRKLLHGMAAVGLSDSDHNVIENNHFVNIRNQAGQERFLHAVYMNVRSDENRVLRNVTFKVSGDPIKVRQFSNRNEVIGNTLRCSGGKSFFLDYPEDFKPASGREPECESWENVFKGNRLDCGYDGGPLQATYGEPGRRCGAPASWQRFRVSDNQIACTSSCN